MGGCGSKKATAASAPKPGATLAEAQGAGPEGKATEGAAQVVPTEEKTAGADTGEVAKAPETAQEAGASGQAVDGAEGALAEKVEGAAQGAKEALERVEEEPAEEKADVAKAAGSDDAKPLAGAIVVEEETQGAVRQCACWGA
mmetsp:Transcript_14601/g.40004  ORF Transcript_14601/g.40004 Transcript_14601/m.40004 type:complete len:143 (-) Transcript_14601:263-691(-)